MKKMLAMLLALALCLGLCACGQEKQPEAPAETSSPGASITKVKPTPAPETPAATAEPAAKPEKPETSPEPTEAPAAADISVVDYCCIAGRQNDNGFVSDFSYVLPELTGADTPYIREINEAVEDIYDAYVQECLDCLEDDLSLPYYCIAYYTGEAKGVHSLLITCDTDWGENYYWCYNYDDAGNEVENEDVLKAAGFTPKKFVSELHDFYELETDLSEFFDDDSWKELQEQTLSEDNCNADIPMAFLPDGDLCFIATIYTPAGAGVYDYAVKFDRSGEIVKAPVGTVMSNQLYGTYLLESEEDSDFADFCEFFWVGDTLTMEVTSFNPEVGSVYSYHAVDIFPEDPAALMRADVTSARVRVLPHCPDVFAGSYFGETGYYTMTVDGDDILFTDHTGGIALFGDGSDARLVYVNRDNVGMEKSVPDTDYDRFDFDAAEQAGITGMWSGVYTDSNNKIHTLTLELTNWGQMRLRDESSAEKIPRILAGSYYIAGKDDDSGALEGAIVYNLVAVGGYKMPVIGSFYLMPDEDDTLLVDVDPDDSSKIIDLNEEYYGFLKRVPDVRWAAEPEVMKLEEDETVEVDILGDGDTTELSYSFERDKDTDAITSLTVTLDGERTQLDDMYTYGAEVYLVAPSLRSAVYLYVDELSDNDYHYTEILVIGPDDTWYGGEFSGGFAGAPTDPENMPMRVRTEILSSANGVRAYRAGIDGRLQAVEPFFHLDSDLKLTSNQDVDCWIVAPDTGELIDSATLPAGTKASLYRTDNCTFMDLLLKDGDVRRLWIDSDSTWPITIGGVDIEKLFDGVVFAG